jgi:NAD+ diphosphatase
MYKFCYLCGGPTTAVTTHDGTHWQCQDCGQTFFNNPKPAAEAILISGDGRVVIAVRGRDPHKGKFDLPGGFIDAGETFEQGIARELTEELGLTPGDYTTPVYLSSGPNKYPWGLEVSDVVAAAFTARLHSSAQLRAHDDVQQVTLMKIDDLKPSYFAWDSQYPLIVAALDYWKTT